MQKLAELSKILSAARVEERAAQVKQDAQAVKAARAKIDKLETEMLSIISRAPRCDTCRLLELRFVDGISAVRVQYIMGISRGTYYRRIRECG